MITITKKCRYALRALDFLAREYGKGPQFLPRISDDTKAPAKFLAAILLDLKHAGLVETRRGSKGGYQLVVPPDSISVGQIVRLIDGPLVGLPCTSEHSRSNCVDCHETQPCQLRLTMKRVHRAVADVLDNMSLSSGFVTAPDHDFLPKLTLIAK